MKTYSTPYPLLMIALICCIISSQSLAQLPVEISLKTPYYIDVDKTEKGEVHEIQEGLLHVQYVDKIGHWKQIPLKMYNWKLELVGTFDLDKAFGMNNYTIDLTKKLAAVDIGKIYFCSMTDESGNKHEWSIRAIDPVKSKDMVVDILINPVHLACSETYGNLVEFYGDIKLGKPPYSIRWYVMNAGKTDFLYQPKEDHVNSSGKTAIIQVDKTPAYYVMMDVTDACGTNAKKMVFLECENNKKKINTVFVDPTQNVMNKSVKTIN